MSDEFVDLVNFLMKKTNHGVVSHIYFLQPTPLSLNLGQSKPHFCHLALYKGKPKGRHSLNQNGSTKASKTSLTAARGTWRKRAVVVDFITAKEQLVCQEKREDLSGTNANRRKL